MIHSVRFTCLLDTNVIYPIDIRDLLFWFASYDLFTPRWSRNIFSEWEMVMRRKGVSDSEILKRVEKAQRAFPDALVEHYESLTESLVLPDENDKHVLAAAIKSNAQIIVTNNLRHFPEEYLSTFGIVAKSADDFLTDTIDLNADLALAAFRSMVLNRVNPNLDEFQVLDRLRKNGLTNTADYFHALL